MFSKRTITKLSILIGIGFIVLSFIGNLLLYKYRELYIVPTIIKMGDLRPEKLKVRKTDINAETLFLFGLHFKFPFYREDIDYLHPTFTDHRLNALTISIKDKNKNKKGAILFDVASNDLESMLGPPFLKIINGMILRENSGFGLITAIDYSSLEDISWWNFIHNIKVTYLLTLKVIVMPAYVEKIYDIETPYIKGILKEGNMKIMGKSRPVSEFRFVNHNKLHTIFFALDEKPEKLRSIISTVQSIDNMDKRYKELGALYTFKGSSKYPEELLLLSMISIKGPTLNNLEDLLSIVENKNYKTEIIEEIKKEADYLKQKRSKENRRRLGLPR